jgi:O-acetyl-ADP-ribose deacetylase
MKVQVKLILGDITKYPSDIIVNSANRSLMRSGGVCGAIHKASGIELEKECLHIKKEKGFDWLGIGEIITTKAYNLAHKYVIHTVGPKKGKDDTSLLINCYLNSLREGDKLKAKSISFPAIATNIYSVPIEESAKIVKEALKQISKLDNIKEILLFFLKEEHIDIYSKVLNEK